MALPKRVKVGGAFFQGYQLSVLTASASYVLHISTAVNKVVNGINFVANDSGAADFVSIGIYENPGTGALRTQIATSIFNPGPGIPLDFRFPALHHIRAGEDLRFIYVNSGSVPLAVNVYVESIQ